MGRVAGSLSHTRTVKKQHAAHKPQFGHPWIRMVPSGLEGYGISEVWMPGFSFGLISLPVYLPAPSSNTPRREPGRAVVFICYLYNNQNNRKKPHRSPVTPLSEDTQTLST